MYSPATLYSINSHLPAESPTLLIGRMQSPQPIVLDALKLSLRDRLLLCVASTPNLLQEGHQMPLVMPGVCVPHMLHRQLLHITMLPTQAQHYSSAASAQTAKSCGPADVREHMLPTMRCKLALPHWPEMQNQVQPNIKC